MAYVSVDADDRLEEGPEGLEFKSFLGTDERGNARPQTTASNLDRGYLTDQSARKGPSGFWTVEYYQPYFDVDTSMVLKRCYSTLLPMSPNYLSEHLTPSADLYGPFWTLTTLIFTLFLSSSLASSISAYLSAPGTAYDYDFHLLSIAVTLVYAYGLGLPVLLWIALRYLGVGEWGVVEAVSIWGYAQFVWIPVSILCVIPVPLLRWILVGIAFGLSGYFLVANVYPVLASAEAKATRLIIIIVALLHAGLALTFKVLFFSYYVVHEIGPGATPIDEPITNATNAVLARIFP
ncbi:Yip1-domain-containing protein [Leucogyrophana mollusca]|uniref:Yip1-domain-containing protein n=1 Tax=Leucogyrophana mollusca TaxID=85980 RepID=A0ACB8BW86_9AGAM|nr:Yip1-domain-containing protein [Leucogyrophana mollusca]